MGWNKSSSPAKLASAIITTNTNAADVIKGLNSTIFGSEKLGLGPVESGDIDDFYRFSAVHDPALETV
eukprot:3576429-Karenia_brevis.AAC.1